MKIRDILKEKGREVITIHTDAGIADIAYVMMTNKIGALLVEEEGKLAGIVTERDIVFVLGETGGGLAGLTAADIMVKKENLIVAELDDDSDQVMAVMIQKNIRHMPVMEEGEIIGVLSIRDVVKAHVKKLQAQVHFLSELNI